MPVIRNQITSNPIMTIKAFILFNLFLCISCQQCDLNGVCSGEFLGLTNEANYTNCQMRCSQTPNCQYFSFCSDSQNCVAFQACTRLEDTANCKSGEVTCPIDGGSDLVCNESGFCTGDIVGATNVDTSDECLQACQAHTDCQWYDYYPSNGNCVFLADCTRDDSSCPECIIGQDDCQQSLGNDNFFV